MSEIIIILGFYIVLVTWAGSLYTRYRKLKIKKNRTFNHEEFEFLEVDK